MYNFLSIFIGALIAIMLVFNGILSESTGNYTSSVIIHIAGLLAVSAILLFSRSKLGFKKDIPLYLYSAGAIGILTVLFNNLSFSNLGAALTLSLGLLGQSVISIIIDHYGMFGMAITKFEKKKIFGLVFIGLGILIMAIY